MPKRRRDFHKSLSYQDRPPQLDGDPLTERTDRSGKLRLFLNEGERLELKRRELLRKAADYFVTQEAPIAEIAKELDVTEDTVYHWLFLDDRADPEWRKTLIGRIIDRILNLDRAYTRAQIAEELGITVSQLQRLLESDDFKEIYAQRFIALRSDPNIKAVQAYVVENLLPRALKVLEQELTDPEVPWSVKDKAIERIFRMTGIGEIKPINDDRHEAIKFLQDHGINVTINIPKEYEDALKSAEVVEGEFQEKPKELPE
jgi:predicted transcriptional regulator